MKNMLLVFSLVLFEITFSQSANPSAALSIDMVLVEGGSYTMGNAGSLPSEGPPHQVSLNSFYIGKYELTQKLWQQVMGNNPAGFKDCPDCPVEQVSPKAVLQFISKLNKLSGKHYRLPTEAEWEYAAAGGNKTKGCKYSGSNDVAEVGWIKTNAESKTHPVGLKKPNELGIYDMSGNVWELCSDWYSPNYYKKSPKVNPRNNHLNMFRVVRGGSWRSPPERCYNSARNRNIRDHHISNGGFRLALDK